MWYFKRDLIIHAGNPDLRTNNNIFAKKAKQIQGNTWIPKQTFYQNKCVVIETNTDISKQLHQLTRLHFDFAVRTCDAFYNDKKLGRISSDLPKQVILAASTFWKDTGFKTTRFEIQ